jgi:ketosteroid isomerase-like protein
MKYIFLIICLFSVMGTVLGQRNDGESQEVLKVARELEQTIIKNDVEQIERLLDDDWMIVGPDGAIIEKARFLGVIKSGVLSHEAMSSDDVRVRVYGTTAIVTAITSSKAKYMDHEFSTRERATDVFVKRDGKWRCVMTQLTTITKN